MKALRLMDYARWSEWVMGGLKELPASLADLFLPRRCAGCEQVWLSSGQGFWCDACLDVLPWIEAPLCTCCGQPYTKSPSSGDHLCGSCELNPPPFESARSATQYAGIVRDRIHQLKFGAQLHWVPALAELLARTLEREARDQVDLIIPAPLHLKRLRQRGFNQSGLLARELGGMLEIAVDFDSLGRKHWTEPQTRLNRQERLQNVRDAFEVTDQPAVEGKRILLLDDVFTTGTTLWECAKTLKSAGALEVHALTVARALPERKPDESALSSMPAVNDRTL